MNKFQKPYSSRTSASRSDSRPAGRPASRSRFGASARPSRGEAFQKFDALCSNCGKKCQVPFRPDGTKPVYCKDCFGIPRDAMAKKQKTFGGQARSLGSIRPATSSAPEGKSIGDLTRQIAAMNTKIDTMLKILSSDSSEE
jgi:CxxC-x17-CxxC domain-containing protein